MFLARFGVLSLRRLWLVGAVCIAVLVSVACSSQVGGGAASTESESLNDAELYELPFCTFTGACSNTSEEEIEKMYQRSRELELVKAECMKRKGFEYSVGDMRDADDYMDSLGMSKHWSDEWVEQYGLGISTQAFAKSAVGSDLEGYDDDAWSEHAKLSDPNLEYRLTLTSSEQQAFQEALYGVSDLERPHVRGGCHLEANETLGTGYVKQLSFQEELDRANREFAQRYLADPRKLEWEKQVGLCMSNAGYDYTNFEQFAGRFRTEVSTIQYQPQRQFPDNYDELNWDERHEVNKSLLWLAESDIDLLAKIQAEEIRAAQTLVSCGGGPLNEAIFAKPIHVEIQKEYLEKNKERLAELEGLFD